MKYKTVDEWTHFSFDDVFLGDVEIMEGVFRLLFDNVIIHEENSCNRDIRPMRCNELIFSVENPTILSLKQERYKVYDANGNLMEQFDDMDIPKEEIPDLVKGFVGGNVYKVDKKEDIYFFWFDTEENTYELQVRGDHDTQSWDRFLTLE